MLLLSMASCGHADTTAKVLEVVDGDSLSVKLARGGTVQVRLYGIDAPEYDQPYGSRARQALAALVAGRTVKLEIYDTDTYGRILACPVVESVDVCKELLRLGSVWVYRHNRADDTLLALETGARNNNLGLWGLGQPPIAPWDWRKRRQAKAPVRKKGCDIKGNISAKGNKIYHVPGQRHYAKTRISVGKGEQWFCSVAEAEGAGWRASAR